MIDFFKKHWFKVAVSASLFLIVLFFSSSPDVVKRSELIELELQLRKEAFDGQQFVIDSLEESISKTELKLVSLQQQFGETKKNLLLLQAETIYQIEQYKALKNEVEKINYSDSSVAAILQRIRAKD